jgi:rubrerythrin
MDSIKERFEEMLAEEEEASDGYVEFANGLYEAGGSRSDAEKIFNIARDEKRHFATLRSLYKKYF